MRSRRRAAGATHAMGRVPKDYRPIFDAAQAQGFTVERSSGGTHFAIRCPDGDTVFAAGTPKDGGRHSGRKIVADLRRHGFTWPAP